MKFIVVYQKWTRMPSVSRGVTGKDYIYNHFYYTLEGEEFFWRADRSKAYRFSSVSPLDALINLEETALRGIADLVRRNWLGVRDRIVIECEGGNEEL